MEISGLVALVLCDANLALGQATGLSTLNIAILRDDRRSLDDKRPATIDPNLDPTKIQKEPLAISMESLVFRVSSVNATMPHVDNPASGIVVNATGDTRTSSPLQKFGV